MVGTGHKRREVGDGGGSGSGADVAVASGMMREAGCCEIEWRRRWGPHTSCRLAGVRTWVVRLAG